MPDARTFQLPHTATGKVGALTTLDRPVVKVLRVAPALGRGFLPEDGRPGAIVVGIMAADFRSEPPAEMWTPLQAVVRADDLVNHLYCLGRLKPGVSREQARADVERVARQFQQEYPALMNDREPWQHYCSPLRCWRSASRLAGP